MPLAIGEYFWYADFPEILDAFLQLVLHHLLLVFFWVFAYRSTILSGNGGGGGGHGVGDCGSGKCFQRQSGGACGTESGQWRGARVPGQGEDRAVQGWKGWGQGWKGFWKRFIVQVKGIMCVIKATDFRYMWVIYGLLHCFLKIWITEAGRQGWFASCQ